MVVSSYGNAAYPLATSLYRPYRGDRGDLPPTKSTFNEGMSRFEIGVEWIFGWLEQMYPFVDDKTHSAVMLRQMGKEDFVAPSLANIHTCLCGGVTIDYL